MASYREAIAWLALNDEQAETQLDELAGLVTFCLVADLFKKKPAIVAADVLAYRIRHVPDFASAESHCLLCDTDPCLRCEVRDAIRKARKEAA